MKISLPRGVNIDIDNVPNDLENIVWRAFAEYTEGTASAYTFADKLCFIDAVTKRLHHRDSGNVQDLIKKRFNYELMEQGRIMDSDEFYGDMAFFEDCYTLGEKDSSLYSYDYCEDRRDNEKIMKILVRVITAVMNWEAHNGE
jgi:hypothetical protein